MSLPEVSEIGHYCKDCENYDEKRMQWLKQPCEFQKRVANGRFCVDFKPKTVQNERENKP